MAPLPPEQGGPRLGAQARLAGPNLDSVPELTSAQYVILAESQRKKCALAECRMKFTALVGENTRLAEQRVEAEQTAYEVTEAMRRDIHAKNERIAALESQLENNCALAKAETHSVKTKLESRLASQQLREQENEACLRDQVESLTSQLKDVASFALEKESLERECLQLHMENKALQTQLEAVKRDMEHKSIQESMTLQKNFDAKYAEMTKRHEEDMAENLDASVKRILHQNQCNAHELQLHIEESSLLHKENKILMEERTQLMQELETKVQMEQGYVSRNAKQSRAIRQANQKLLALEHTMQDLVENFEKERQFMRQQWSKALEELSRQLDSHKRLADLKTKDARNVRRLAQEVLLQRSDTEVFFISSLQHVRGMISQDQQNAGARQSQPERATISEVDISDLTWEQREKVLRHLFTKINQQARKFQMKRLHPVSFTEAVQQHENERQAIEPLAGVVTGAGKPKMA